MALIAFLEGLPLWLLAIVLAVWLMGTVLVGLWIFRRHVLPRLGINFNNAYYVAPLMQSSVLLYGLIAALTAVGAWTRYLDVSRIVSAEATAITILWRDLGGYPEPLRSSTRDVLRGYTDQVIHGAWPQLKQGKIPREGVEWMDRLQSLIDPFEPATDGQRIRPRRDATCIQRPHRRAASAIGRRAGGAARRSLVRAAGRRLRRSHDGDVLLRGERPLPGLHAARLRGVAFNGAARHFRARHAVHGRNEHRFGGLPAGLRPTHDGQLSAETRCTRSARIGLHRVKVVPPPEPR